MAILISTIKFWNKSQRACYIVKTTPVWGISFVKPKVLAHIQGLSIQKHFIYHYWDLWTNITENLSLCSFNTSAIIISLFMNLKHFTIIKHKYDVHQSPHETEMRPKIQLFDIFTSWFSELQLNVKLKVMRRHDIVM